jgi:multidrug efflux pump
LSLGAAATSRIPLGIVIVGGIMFSLVLTLYVIPAMYTFLSFKKKKSELELMEENEKQTAAVHEAHPA